MAKPRSTRLKHLRKARLEMGRHLLILGNVAAGAFLFSQARPGVPVDVRLAIIGLAIVFIAYRSAWRVMTGGDEK